MFKLLSHSSGLFVFSLFPPQPGQPRPVNGQPVREAAAPSRRGHEVGQGGQVFREAPVVAPEGAQQGEHLLLGQELRGGLQLLLGHGQVPDQVLGPLHDSPPVGQSHLELLPLALPGAPPEEGLQHYGLCLEAQRVPADDHLNGTYVEVLKVLAVEHLFGLLVDEVEAPLEEAVAAAGGGLRVLRRLLAEERAALCLPVGRAARRLVH